MRLGKCYRVVSFRITIGFKLIQSQIWDEMLFSNFLFPSFFMVFSSVFLGITLLLSRISQLPARIKGNKYFIVREINSV